MRINQITFFLTIVLLYLNQSYVQSQTKPIYPNLKADNYKVEEKGKDYIIYLGNKEYYLSGGALYVDMDLSKEMVTTILSEKESPNSTSWWSYHVGYKDLPLFKSYNHSHYSKPQDKPKWGNNRYRLNGFIGYIPGVGLVGRHEPYYSKVRIVHGKRKQKPLSRDINWIISEDGKLVLPRNNEYVRQSVNFTKPFLAERTFYGFGAEGKDIINDSKNIKEKKPSAAYLFKGENIEKEWTDLVDLKDGYWHSQYFQFDTKGFIQFGKTLDDQAIITTLNPDLTIKSDVGPVLMVHTMEGTFFTADVAKGKRAPDDLGRMLLIENHDLAGVFSKLESDGSIYIPQNSLGIQPLFTEINYGATTASKSYHLAYGFIIPYFLNNKFQWGVAQVSNYADPKIDFTVVNNLKQPLYSEVEPFFSQKMRFHQFYSINPYMIFAKSLKTGNWECLTHRLFIPQEVDRKNLETMKSFVESEFIEKTGKEIAAYIAHSEKLRAEAKQRYEDWVKYDKSKEAEAERKIRAEKQRIASLPWSPIGGDRSQRWQGFSYSQQMQSLYRQNVINSAKTWPGTTKITTTYQNGRITGISTSGAW